MLKKISELRWPIGIIMAILGVMALGAWTIEQANIKPVAMDDYYFDSYQNVERNINDIIKSQQAFDKNYKITLDNHAFTIGDNALAIKIVNKSTNAPVEDANVTVKITRPDTNIYDKMPKVVSATNGEYKLENFKVNKIGRWQIMAKITVNNLISFTKTEVNATN